jgi:transposase
MAKTAENGNARQKHAGLTSRQAAYVAHRLSGLTQKSAAEKASISPRTAHGWDRLPAVAEALRRGQDELIAEASGTATALLRASVVKLMEIGSDSDAPTSARVAALRAVADLALTLRNAHILEARIAALEAANVRT